MGEVPSVLSAVVELRRTHERVTDSVWLPPAADQHAGHAGVRPRERRLHTPIGVLDDPAHQWQGTWSLDLTRAGGHVAMLGGPSSGKSTLLRTVATSLGPRIRPPRSSCTGST